MADWEEGQQTLFGGREQPAPLADRLRPRELTEFSGQQHLWEKEDLAGH